MTTVEADLTRFTQAGYGQVHGEAARGLRVGDTVTVRDLTGSDEDDDLGGGEVGTLEGVVVRVADGTATVHVTWDGTPQG